MTNEEIKELEKRTYAICWSGFPIDTLFNDIKDNDNPRFNKDLAYQDFKKVIDGIYKLKDKAEKYDEKEKPKKVKPFPNSFYIKICPNCGSTLETKRSYCEDCGQALDWSGEDDK